MNSSNFPKVIHGIWGNHPNVDVKIPIDPRYSNPILSQKLDSNLNNGNDDLQFPTKHSRRRSLATIKYLAKLAESKQKKAFQAPEKAPMVTIYPSFRAIARNMEVIDPDKISRIQTRPVTTIPSKQLLLSKKHFEDISQSIGELLDKANFRQIKYSKKNKDACTMTLNGTVSATETGKVETIRKQSRNKLIQTDFVRQPVTYKNHSSVLHTDEDLNNCITIEVGKGKVSEDFADVAASLLSDPPMSIHPEQTLTGVAVIKKTQTDQHTTKVVDHSSNFTQTLPEAISEENPTEPQQKVSEKNSASNDISENSISAIEETQIQTARPNQLPSAEGKSQTIAKPAKAPANNINSNPTEVKTIEMEERSESQESSKLPDFFTRLGLQSPAEYKIREKAVKLKYDNEIKRVKTPHIETDPSESQKIVIAEKTHLIENELEKEIDLTQQNASIEDLITPNQDQQAPHGRAKTAPSELKSILKKKRVEIRPLSSSSTSSRMSGYAKTFSKNLDFHVDPTLFKHFGPSTQDQVIAH